MTIDQLILKYDPNLLKTKVCYRRFPPAFWGIIWRWTIYLAIYRRIAYIEVETSCIESFLDARETRRELKTASLRVFLWSLEESLARIYQKLANRQKGGVFGIKSYLLINDPWQDKRTWHSRELIYYRGINAILFVAILARDEVIGRSSN
jgi:GAF domain-containing protein